MSVEALSVDRTPEENEDFDEVDISLEDIFETEEYAKVNTSDLVTLYKRSIKHVTRLTKEDEAELSKQIEAGLFASELIDASENPEHPLRVHWESLSDDDRELLPEVVNEGDQAKVIMIESNAPFVIYLARGFNRYGLHFLDLVQEGNIGLMHAVEKFDYQRGFRFGSYASRWIRQSITRGIPGQVWASQLPSYLFELNRSLDNTIRLFAAKNGREPSLEELAEESGVKQEKILEIRERMEQVYSLDVPVHVNKKGGTVDELTLRDIIADEKSQRDVEEVVDRQSLVEEIEEIFAQMEERDAKVMRLRFGFVTGELVKRDEVGKQFDMKFDAVARLEKRVIKKLSKDGWLERLDAYRS